MLKEINALKVKNSSFSKVLTLPQNINTSPTTPLPGYTLGDGTQGKVSKFID